MFIIEPCCTQKHIPALRDKVAGGGTCLFHGFGDLSLAELLPVLMTRYTEADVTIAAPSLPDSAAAAVADMMERQWPSKDGKGTVHAVRHLTILTSLRKAKSPTVSAWQKENPYGERLTLHGVQQNDTAVILPDFAILGPLNLSYGGHFTALATTSGKLISSLLDTYRKL